jgi:hypothetical protein
MTQPYAHTGIYDMDPRAYSPLEIDVRSGLLQHQIVSLSPVHYDISVDPRHTTSNPQPSLIPSSLANISTDQVTHNPSLIWNAPTYTSHTQSNASSSMSTNTTASTTPSSAMQAIVPATGTSRRAKFPCPSCGKLCTSRPRALTCFFDHIGTKPFICNGTCGLVGW